MRLIFITLAILNVLLLVWGVFLKEDVVGSNSPVIKPVSAKVKSIAAKPGATSAKPADSGVGGLAGATSAEALCELIGPFAADADAEVFAERLRAIDIKSSIERVELPAGSSYWVHLPAQETSAAAYQRLTEMQSYGIESYVIGQGELKNAVSVGVFTREDLAIAKKNELERRGVETNITVKSRTEIEIWVMIQPEFAQKISTLTWPRLLDGMTSQERRQNYCLPVAS